MRYALALATMLMVASTSTHAEPKTATLYKNPQCGCCEGYADYLRENGFKVTVVPTHDMTQIKREHGVPEAVDGCHTTLIDKYVVEGHVPIKSIHRLLMLRPQVDGISLPGMPQGSPGMSGQKTEPFVIHQFANGATTPFYIE